MKENFEYQFMILSLHSDLKPLYSLSHWLLLDGFNIVCYSHITTLYISEKFIENILQR